MTKDWAEQKKLCLLSLVTEIKLTSSAIETSCNYRDHPLGKACIFNLLYTLYWQHLKTGFWQ